MCRHLEDGSSFDGFRISLDLLGLFGCSPLNFTMLWSSYACRPSGYLNVAWSQSPINQISSDLAGLADKTLHGRRKWQTVGDKRPACWDAMKRDWSTAPQTPSGCLHEFCFIWFSFWFLSLWRVTLFPSQSNSVTNSPWVKKKNQQFSKGLNERSDIIQQDSVINCGHLTDQSNQLREAFQSVISGATLTEVHRKTQTWQSFCGTWNLQKNEWRVSLCIGRQYLGGPIVGSPLGGIK